MIDGADDDDRDPLGHGLRTAARPDLRPSLRSGFGTPVPCRKGATEVARPAYLDAAGMQGGRPSHQPEVPAREHEPIGHHHDNVVAEARIDAADLAVAPFDKKPVLHPPPALMELEPDHHSPVGEQIAAQIGPAPRPQDVIGLRVFVCQFRPLFGSTAERIQDIRQVSAC